MRLLTPTQRQDDTGRYVCDPFSKLHNRTEWTSPRDPVVADVWGTKAVLNSL